MTTLQSVYKDLIKPVMDFCVSLICFIILLPVFIPIVLILFIINKGGVFFFQKRPGKKEKIFLIIKFKTMNDNKDESGQLLSDTLRLTKFGKFLRETSLDEIPQLLNVLKGDMSIVGPRPLLPEYLPFYNEYHRRRHEVKPGITGLAQTKGRNKVKFSERFNLDVIYVTRLSFALDMVIIWNTLPKIFKGSDVVHGQTLDEVDDLGITQDLRANYSK
ncbi:sugar transferase [Chitinophaga sp. 212800010-3]|uniref:sugar transferase n=1 Tax=unclassified Chitinophaga TaxID=2619133 RepID=UPI002DF54704|nr:Bacterial sugar transferase [Chitinophaga sp. 212800010-3]